MPWYDFFKLWTTSAVPNHLNRPTNGKDTADPSTAVTKNNESTTASLISVATEKMDSGPRHVLPQPERLMAHLRDDLRSKLWTIAYTIDSKSVTQWPDPEPDAVWEGCAFHKCALDNVPALLVVRGEKWLLWRDVQPGWRKDHARIWTCMRTLFVMPTLFPEQPQESGFKILNERMTITQEALLALCQEMSMQGRQALALSAFNATYFEGRALSACLWVHSPNTGYEIWFVVAQNGGIVCLPATPSGEQSGLRPKYVLDAKRFSDVGREWRSFANPAPGLSELLGAEKKGAAKVFYVAPPLGRKVREVKAPTSPEEARVMVDDVGVIVPSRSKYLPRSSGKGRGRPHVYCTETVKGYLHWSVRSGKAAGMEVFAHLEDGGALTVLEVVQHLHPPTPNEVDHLVGVIEESLLHIPLLGKSAGSSWRAASQGFVMDDLAFKQSIREKATEMWGETWTAMEAAKARKTLSRAIPDGTLVLRGTNHSFHWSFKVPQDGTDEHGDTGREKDILYLISTDQVPSTEDMRARMENSGFSAHRTMSALSRCQALGAHVCEDEKLANLRWPENKPLPTKIELDPLWWDLLERYALTNRKVAEPAILGTMHLFHTEGPYPELAKRFRYKFSAPVWDPNLIPWDERFRAKKPGTQTGTKPQKLLSYDLFVLAFLGMFCSQRARTVLEGIGVEPSRFHALPNMEGFFAVEIEETKEDLYAHPQMRSPNRPLDHRWEMPSNYNKKALHDLFAKPLVLEGGHLWRSTKVAPYGGSENGQVFACSGEMMNACVAARLKIAESVTVAVVTENPYPGADSALLRKK